MKGVKVRLKKGAPTEILAPSTIWRTSGASVPTKTTPAAVASSRLFRTSAPSRLTG